MTTVSIAEAREGYVMVEASPKQPVPADRRAGSAGIDSRLLAVVAAQVTRQIGRALADEELSVEQWAVLDHLDRSGPCTMSMLARATGINGATLTRLVDRLVSHALVYRSADRDDRRRVLVHLSERGRRTTERVRPLICATEEEIASPLSSSERDVLTQLLRRMSDLPGNDN